MQISFRMLMAPVAVSVMFAAGSATAATYGSYADHEVDVASTLSASFQNVVTNSWVNLSAFAQNGVPGLTGTGSFPGTTMWAPKASQIDSVIGDAGGTAGGATLTKVSNSPGGGGAYAASSGLYFGGFSGDVNVNGGSLAVVDSSPLAGLQHISFQVGIGEASTYDFYNHVLPTLTYTTSLGTVSSVVATNSSILEAFNNGTVTMPTGEEPIYINQYLLQWDLSNVNEQITSFSIGFTGVQHAQVYGLTLTQAAVAAVPEPSTYAMLLSGMAMMGVVGAVRRRQRQA
ncbi:MAG: PEP-CTERM sorting domain-containing protein [Aquabacterium sp.]|uniref:PEP-CTERM sorting domain-containing protein n=1 Tax=Aquabacterium sp. TaxID=1872578 RepID=UPI003BB13139